MIIRNTHPLRCEYESLNIALMLSASYVMTTLNKEELIRQRTIKYSTIIFQDRRSVVVVSGKRSRGKLGRLAYPSVDGAYIRYSDPQNSKRFSFLSTTLIRAEVLLIDKFINSLSCAKTYRATSINSPDKPPYIGLLFGSINNFYRQIVVLKNDDVGFELIDVEKERVLDRNKHNLYTLEEDNSKSAIAVRKKLLGVCKTYV